MKAKATFPQMEKINVIQKAIPSVDAMANPNLVSAGTFQWAFYVLALFSRAACPRHDRK